MTQTCKIKALNGNNRMSTQNLLQLIYEKVEKGYCDFEIEACGQHDIGCALYPINKKKKLTFKIKNPGQRVGAMALDKTKIIVEGSASADVGWLNSGAEIIVKGDAGDTAGHCAASGKIYVAGRVGTRSGALMKHDPKFEQPELWVLKNTGSFSFEFMGGGIAVVCGYDCETLDSILGHRSCVGMVGGVIYVRGDIKDLADNVDIVKLDKNDIEFLSNGIKKFLKEIGNEKLYPELTKFSQWRKIIPLNNKIDNKTKQERLSLKEFRKTQWFKGGLFGDLVEDDNDIYFLAEADKSRLRKPVWNKKNCVDCKLCLNNCPNSAIKCENKKYSSNDKKCIGCGICAAVCPKGAWEMVENK